MNSGSFTCLVKTKIWEWNCGQKTGKLKRLSNRRYGLLLWCIFLILSQQSSPVRSYTKLNNTDDVAVSTAFAKYLSETEKTVTWNNDAYASNRSFSFDQGKYCCTRPVPFPHLFPEPEVTVLEAWEPPTFQGWNLNLNPIFDGSEAAAAPTLNRPYLKDVSST